MRLGEAEESSYLVGASDVNSMALAGLRRPEDPTVERKTALLLDPSTSRGGLMGEKKWNATTGRWEIDGVPITYRVTWKSIDTGEEHVRDFNDIDQGYDFYQLMQRDAYSIKVTWDHVPW